MKPSLLKKQLTSYRLEVAAAVQTLGIGLQHLDQAGDALTRGASPAEEIADAGSCFDEAALIISELADCATNLAATIRLSELKRPRKTVGDDVRSL